LLAAACGRDEQPEFRAGMAALKAGNYAEAYCHWKSQAARGYAPAERQIGWLYANGQGMALNDAKALEWWRRAARHGDTNAQFALAQAYVDGMGVKADPARAVPWLEQAMTGGEDDAGRMLRALAGKGVAPALALVGRIMTGPNWRSLGGVQRVKVERANVRSALGADKSRVATLARGAEVVVLQAERDWMEVLLPGRREPAWIYAPLLEPEGKP
jgi:hypothetical protein